LVIVGIVTFIVIGWQSWETHRAADAAAKSVEAINRQSAVIIESQRPHIAAKVHGNPVKTFVSDIPRMEMELQNVGATPAYGLVYETWMELLYFPFVDFTSNADHHTSKEPSVIYPGRNPMILNIPLRAGVTPAQMNQVRNLALYVCIRIHVHYHDGYRNEHDANFGLYLQPDGLGFLPKYND
jgi:hypothetical protein